MKPYLLIFFLAFAACQRQEIILEKEKVFENNIWQADSICKFHCSIADTSTPYNIYFTLSNTNTYRYQNLYMFVTINFPNGITRIDTVDCFLADSKGKWYGKELSGSIFKQKLMYRPKVLFPHTGTYEFKIEQAMRQNHLKGMHAIGIVIEKTRQ